MAAAAAEEAAGRASVGWMMGGWMDWVDGWVGRWMDGAMEPARDGMDALRQRV